MSDETQGRSGGGYTGGVKGFSEKKYERKYILKVHPVAKEMDASSSSLGASICSDGEAGLSFIISRISRGKAVLHFTTLGLGFKSN